jgi:hypothetical protein
LIAGFVAPAGRISLVALFVPLSRRGGVFLASGVAKNRLWLGLRRLSGVYPMGSQLALFV